MKQNNKLLLNGEWRMDYLGNEPYMSEIEPDFTGVEGGFSIQNAVPGYWEDMLDEFRKTALHTKLSWNPLYTLQRYPQSGYVPDMALPNVSGCFVYKRSIHVSKADTLYQAELYVGGAQNAVSAWINGHYLGRHEGYSSPFSFTIPVDVLVEGENRVTLVVSNTRLEGYMGRPVSGLTSRAANECTGGIYGDVEIRIYRDGLRDFWVSTAEDLSSFTVHIDGAEDIKKTVRILDGKTILYTAELMAGEREITIPADGYKLWSPDAPKRYLAEFITENQSMACHFGIRCLTVIGTKLYLNGNPYFFRGVCEHCYHPITVHPTRDKLYYRKVIRTMKKLGFNAIRFHTYVPMAEYMEAADELGILIEIETPNNTTYNEWCDIVRFARRYTSPVLYSSGNEMTIDEDYIEHLRNCAKLVHEEGSALFSPMSAMRGIEYVSFGDCRVDEPFPHNPKRLATLGEFCDVYNSYSLRLTSYESEKGDYTLLNKRNAIYGKPLLSHEICIHGTYCDLSLKDRYRGSRIGDTELFTSVERHLEEKGLLDRAPMYYRNSVAWQMLLRKHCFELMRRTETFAGYDFLGDIDTHWHTFGYCVGMMNEFYELKPGETVENVRRYNSDTVLLADLPSCLNLEAGTKVEIPILVSNFGERLEKVALTLHLADKHKVYLRKEIRLGEIKNGEVTELYRLLCHMPKCDKPKEIKLTVRLEGGNTNAENEWTLYVFPKAAKIPTDKMLKQSGVTVAREMDANTLWQKLRQGEKVLLFGTGPFAAVETSFQLSVAGRTNGHLATAINDHALMEDFPHDGYCGWQFRGMMNGGKAVVLDLPKAAYAPIVEIASSYKNARREALMFEYTVGNGKLFVCTLNLSENDPGACWLKSRIISYVMGEEFAPAESLTFTEFAALCDGMPVEQGANANEALNKNDITMN